MYPQKWRFICIYPLTIIFMYQVIKKIRIISKRVDLKERMNYFTKIAKNVLLMVL